MSATKQKKLSPHNDSKYYQMNPIPPRVFQNNVSPTTILGLDTNNKINSNPEGYILEFHTPENLLRLTHHKYDVNKWQIILLMKCVQDGDKTTLKGALRNRETNKIALITSVSNEWLDDYKKGTLELKFANSNEIAFKGKATSRLVNSCDNNYKICLCKMVAPLFFWKELKNRLS